MLKWQIIQSIKKKKKIEKYLEYKNCSFYWNPLFIKQLNEWELELMASALDDIYALKLHNGLNGGQII